MRWILRAIVVAALAACVWLLGQDDSPARTGFQSFAKYQGEEEAVLGVGLDVAEPQVEKAVLAELLRLIWISES